MRMRLETACCGGMTRRSFMHRSAALGAGMCLGGAFAETPGAQDPDRLRRFHASLSIQALEEDPELLPTVAKAGIDAVWVAAFLQAAWIFPPEAVTKWKKRINDAGMAMHHITVPLGHPSFTDDVPDYIKGAHYLPWQAGQRPDGARYHGVCFHPPASEVNADAVATLYAAAPGTIFLDDDFRLAPSPNDIGGCFCAKHREAFLAKHGYPAARWEELIDNVNQRALTPLLRAWVEDACDELTGCFRAQQRMLPDGMLGIMVMYFGSERAGIRLSDYTEVPMRVGECMFNDPVFAPVKGKTDELFSVLFHRCYARPENAYSESTAWPPDGLSAANLAAKLAISTLADVRNTMLMSGITPYPIAYWDTLAPAIKTHAQLHQKLAGHVPRGPFKHFWGERSRWAGDANPFSLFLAAGVPFEVTRTLSPEGYTFLSEADARAVAEGALKPTGGTLIYRDDAGVKPEGARALPESLEALFALKREILPQLGGVPVVVEDVPVVCGWYPTAGTAALWNLSEEACQVTVKYGERRWAAELPALGMTLVENVG